MGEERQQLAAVVEALAVSGARVVALDILLTDIGRAGLDALLADALGRVPTIVAGAAGGLMSGGGIGIPCPPPPIGSDGCFTPRPDSA